MIIIEEWKDNVLTSTKDSSTSHTLLKYLSICWFKWPSCTYKQAIILPYGLNEQKAASTSYSSDL